MAIMQFNVKLDENLVELVKTRIAECECTVGQWVTRIFEEALEMPIQTRVVTKQIEERW